MTLLYFGLDKLYHDPSGHMTGSSVIRTRLL